MTNVHQGLLSGSTDLQSALKTDLSHFPFRSELSLAPLIAFWTRPSSGSSPLEVLARMVGDKILDPAGELSKIEDPAAIAERRDVVDVLMAAVFPPASWEQDYGAAMIPFHLRGFYATPSMQRLLMGADGSLQGRVNLDEPMVGAMRVAYAYALVLERVYGITIDVEYPLVITIADPDTGLDRHFKIQFDWQFVDVVPVGAVPPLTDAVRQRLHTNILDAAMLREVLPPEKFVFRGVTIFRAIEVTDQEVLSALKRDLIDRESIVSQARFEGLQQRLRTLFRRPELRLGLAALDGDRVLILNYGARHEHACIFADSAHHRTSEFERTIYQRSVLAGQPIIVPDLAALPNPAPIERQLVLAGARNFVCAPLRYQDKVIGTLTLGSPHPGDLDATHLPKLYEVLPLFSMAVQRSMEELNSRIQTQIKERFTAIHPVVEWRFRQALLDGLERHGVRPGLELEPIVFENVYPLYALSDIRGSSTQRALAIQHDLLAQLRLGRDVVEAARQSRPLPALDELCYRIERQMARVEENLASGDEVEVISFLRSHCEGLFEHLQTFGAGVRDRIDAYRAALDPRRGAVYSQRQVFEQSVTRIADTISSYLDLEEQAAQGMFPHYFEKQKTDGVDHQIYVGASLVEGGQFDPLYLKNLRLWQLMVVCGIAARADELSRTLALPLRTTHLILVQHAPLAIRFRFDEKRFDVDGAYDIRYEIAKKRIDKAVVRGTGERVTQPGRIAIVYSQPGEAAEYRGYLEYLQHLGYLGGEVEDLALEELQGIQGLRALRVAVALHGAPAEASAAVAAEHVSRR
ncbi:MAG: GAF domain-containing protein [Candidatus Rokuibacteriota bacterium]|nr:MAG: GAF domain-containing protein [Candidatus Rokubacteria bacterium]